MDSALELLQEVMRYRRGEGAYNFSRLSPDERENATFDAWQELEFRIDSFLCASKNQEQLL